MVGARLHRHEERRAAGPLAGGSERDDLAVPAAVGLGHALADDRAVGNEHGADGRDSGSRTGPARVDERERAVEAHAAAARIRAYAAPGSGSAKTAFPATSRVAPASRTALAFASRRRRRPGSGSSTSVRELLDPRECLGHERLTRVARLDAHAEDHVGAGQLAAVAAPRRCRGGIEGDADREPVRARRCGDLVGSSVASTWKVTESAPDSANSGKWCAGSLDHQVAVDHASGRVDHRRDRAQHDRPDRHRRDEVPVADVEVEDAAAGREEHVDLLTEAGEVGGIERRLDLASRPGSSSSQPMRAILRNARGAGR